MIGLFIFVLRFGGYPLEVRNGKLNIGFKGRSNRSFAWPRIPHNVFRWPVIPPFNLVRFLPPAAFTVNELRASLNFLSHTPQRTNRSRRDIFRAGLKRQTTTHKNARHQFHASSSLDRKTPV